MHTRYWNNHVITLKERMRRKKQSFTTNKLLFKIEMLLFWDSPKNMRANLLYYIIYIINIYVNIVIYWYKQIDENIIKNI